MKTFMLDTWFIWLVAVCCIIIYVIIKLKIINIYEILEPNQRIANQKKKIKKIQNTSDKHEIEDVLKRKLKSLNTAYTLYGNLVSIFPLLGMFGTVYSLYSLANNISDINSGMEMGNFFTALSTTIAGIVCAVLGKFFDSFISPSIVDVNKEYDLYTDRNTRQGDN